jgi:acetyl-CoA carboxylase biotin carboxyl carrier protein
LGYRDSALVKYNFLTFLGTAIRLNLNTMTLKEIQELIRLIGKSNLAEFKLREGDFELTMRTDLYSETKSTKVITSAPVLPVAPAPIVAQPVGQFTPTAAVPETAAPKEKPVETSTPSVSIEADNFLKIKSPMVGTFYRSSTPEKPPFAEIGSKVKKGDTVCIIEAMKLFNEIESDVSGTVVKVMVEDAQPVEYDQILFLVKPE